jgi:hypothetical protein
MNHLEKIRAQRIVALHNEVTSHLKMSLQKAIEVGELLTEQKQSLNHGDFTPWIKDNLPFTEKTAQNYMRLHRERDRLKTETVSDLKSAYKLLSAPENDREQVEALQHAAGALDFDFCRVLYDPPSLADEWDYDKSVKKMRRLISKRRKVADEVLSAVVVAENQGIPVSKICRDTEIDRLP